MIDNGTTYRGLLTGVCLALAAQGAAAQLATGGISSEAEEDEPIFTYDGSFGPEVWGDLVPSWATCGTGELKSPIDLSIRDSASLDLPAIEFNYDPTMINTLNNGHTVEIVCDPGSYIMVGNQRFDLFQFHFHSPSEHNFEGGARFAVEMHLVHRDANGRLAVLAVLINRGDENPAFANTRFLRQILPCAAGVSYSILSEFNVETLVPDDLRAHVYKGSQTTPPCSEGVLWMVLQSAIEMSEEQIEALNEALDNLESASVAGADNRPTQPLNGRVIGVNLN